jgi:hypothetical protein
MFLARLKAIQVLGFAALVIPPVSARASLGGKTTSVEDDRAVVQASRTVTELDVYSVHELAIPTGTVVREFVSPGGTVFAVSWHGPFIPDLRLFLGEHFGAFAEAVARTPRRPGHGSLLVNTPHLVVESVGHMRAFAGRAYLPARLPAGLDEGAIR